MDNDISLVIFVNVILWIFVFDVSIISYVVMEDLFITLVIAGGWLPPLVIHTIYTFYLVWKYRERD